MPHFTGRASAVARANPGCCPERASRGCARTRAAVPRELAAAARGSLAPIRGPGARGTATCLALERRGPWNRGASGQTTNHGRRRSRVRHRDRRGKTGEERRGGGKKREKKKRIRQISISGALWFSLIIAPPSQPLPSVSYGGEIYYPLHLARAVLPHMFSRADQIRLKR